MSSQATVADGGIRADGGIDLAAMVGAFGAELRSAGLDVTAQRCGWLASAMTFARPYTRDEFYWLARATLLTHRDQVQIFDGVFEQIFVGIMDFALRNPNTNMPPLTALTSTNRPKNSDSPSAPPTDGPGSSMPRAPGSSESSNDDEYQPEQEAVLAALSLQERLNVKDFGSCTPEELLVLQTLLSAMFPAAPQRVSRRMKRHRHGVRLDMRATVRASHRTAGDPVRQITRKRRVRARRVVLIADVSGSMEAYSRAYLYLLHGAVRAMQAEAFLFATRLTRVSRQLRVSSPEAALRTAMRAAEDFGGGTRIGEAMKRFNDGWGRRGLARRAVIVIVSDGWEAADPELLRVQMERLSRLAYKIVWVNPRKQSARYVPAVGGMKAALPYVDDFVSGHSLQAMREVVAAIAQ